MAKYTNPSWLNAEHTSLIATEILESINQENGVVVSIGKDIYVSIGDDLYPDFTNGKYGEIEEFYSPELNGSVINEERDRRIAMGFLFAGKIFDSRPDDQTNIAGAAQLAFMAIVSGAKAGNLRWHGGESDFCWITQDNTLMPMDAQTVVALGRAAAAWKQAHIFTARAMKNMETIPADFRYSKLWPVNV